MREKLKQGERSAGGIDTAKDDTGGTAAVEDSKVTKLVEALLPLLENKQSGVRKRTTTMLCLVAAHVSEQLVKRVCDTALDTLEGGNTKIGIQRTLVSLLGSMCKSIHYKFATFIPRTLPLLTAICEKKEDDAEDEELREACLQVAYS